MRIPGRTIFAFKQPPGRPGGFRAPNAQISAVRLVRIGSDSLPLTSTRHSQGILRLHSRRNIHDKLKTI